LKICRLKSLAVIAAGIFPWPTFCGGRGDQAPKRKAFRLPPEREQVAVRAGEATDNAEDFKQGAMFEKAADARAADGTLLKIPLC
jgi:hypothetical protein